MSERDKRTCPLGEDCDLTVAWMAGRADAKKETAKWQSKVAKQRNEIGRLTKQVEIEQHSKRDHIFRLRMLLSRALRDDPAWREDAQRELGVVDTARRIEREQSA